MWVDQGPMHIGPIILSLNPKLCVSLPSIFPWLTGVEASAISTSPYNNSYIVLQRQVLHITYYCAYVIILHVNACSVRACVQLKPIHSGAQTYNTIYLSKLTEDPGNHHPRLGRLCASSAADGCLSGIRLRVG